MSEITPFGGQTPDNFNTRCLCVLVLDISGSMDGGPIDELNKGLISFREFLVSRNSTRFSVETAVVTFNSSVECVQQPALIDQVASTNRFPLRADGTTKMVDGIREAIRVVEERKRWYRANGLPYYRPWIVLMTDGHPDPNQDVEGLSKELKQGHDGKHYSFLPMGVEGANQHVLQKLSTPEFPPIPIDWKKFQEVFKWLSNSLDAVSRSAEGQVVKYDPITDFTRTGWGGGDFTQTNI